MTEARTQRLRDPVHGLIVFRDTDPLDQLAWRLIGTPEFQRLRRIGQLGVSEGRRHAGPPHGAKLMGTWELTTSRRVMAEALTFVTAKIRMPSSRERKRTLPDLVRFDFDSGFLDIVGPGAARSIPASGTWPASMRMNVLVVKRLATRLPAGEPLTLKIEDSRLHLCGFSLGVEVLDIAPETLLLPAELESGDILAAVERHGMPKVLANMPISSLERASQEMAQCVTAATESLAGFGVTRADIEAVVRTALRRKAGLA